MGFWIFMLVVDLFIPLTMIGIGALFRIHPPQQINFLYGYRTAMSMKNTDTWLFANRYFARIWLWAGVVLLLRTWWPLLFCLGKSTEYTSVVGLVVCLVQVLVLLLSLIPVECALRRTFDAAGNRR